MISRTEFSDIKPMALRRRRWKFITRAGIVLPVVMALFAVSSCYYPNHQAVYQPVSENGGNAKPPVTQIYFYPKAGQTPEQQDRDRYECYLWAVNQTGFDPSRPSTPPDYRVSVVPSPPPGHDTAIGAVAGALIGAVAAGPRHAAGGAVIGAGAGAVAGAVSDAARQESAMRMEESYARQDRARNAQLEKKALEYRRAMSACLEGRGYSVR
ncbi:MAG: glycine zipper family protein [Syntrophales bacterium]